MTKQLACVTRIFNEEGDVAGVGFWVPERCVLTHPEVVSKALGRAPKKKGSAGPLTLDFPFRAPGEKCRARVSLWPAGGKAKASPLGKGVAVLELESEPPERAAFDARKPDDDHYLGVVDALSEGKAVLFLGAGASLVDRPPDADWQLRYLPSGSELAAYLAKKFRYLPSDLGDLLRISQYATLKDGQRLLYERLRELFVAKYQPNSLHQFLASLPGELRKKKCPQAQASQFIVTTNYDDLLEQSFQKRREPYDLLTYLAVGNDRGKFLHMRYNGRRPDPKTPDGMVGVINSTHEYDKAEPEKRTIILKVHGAVHRGDSRWDSYVITENDYIEYLARAEVKLAEWLPPVVATRLRNGRFLFMGYGLRDWNLRVILHRISAEGNLPIKSWAIERSPAELDERFWKERDVEMLQADLSDYVKQLGVRLGEMRPYRKLP